MNAGWQVAGQGKIGTTMTKEEILSVFRKCFPRGLPIRDEDVLYFAEKLLEKSRQ